MEAGPTDQLEASTMQDGDDFACPNCGCEIRLTHHGDPAKMPRMEPFMCCCGTRMMRVPRSRR
jgi:hypothetical protein